WPLGELWVDALAFTAHAKHSRSIDHRAAALALYRGDLLPEDVDAWWTEPMRTRLRLMHLELLRDPDSGTPPWIDLRTAALATQS
ncbi:MAG TPA: bacterial transcriptional activator domain-containing protein, partial [Mycobacteriales bacterium]|nr:bacterial transcriptional activator domain-containing protein [Mycobacteriales bacterium]